SAGSLLLHNFTKQRDVCWLLGGEGERPTRQVESLLVFEVLPKLEKLLCGAFSVAEHAFRLVDYIRHGQALRAEIGIRFRSELADPCRLGIFFFTFWPQTDHLYERFLHLLLSCDLGSGG